MSFFNRLKQALFKTGTLIPNREEKSESSQLKTEEKILINEDFFDSLLEKLIKADVGLDLSEKIVEDLKSSIKEKEISDIKLKTNIKSIIKSSYRKEFKQAEQEAQLTIFLITGVNGSGKTTSIGKLANKFRGEGNKVLIVAGDTFRAAAEEQLNIWAERSGVEIFSPKEIKKPDAVVYSSLEKANKEHFNLVIIDTAGRLHSQINLMEELKKLDSVVNKFQNETTKIEKLIVLDATIGQNAINQAEMFSKVVGLTGIILSKLDSSAKGGVILNIMNKLSLPVLFIGTGEKIEDIVDFNFDEYLDGLLN